MYLAELLKIGTRIKQLRKKKGYSQKEFAQMVDMPCSTYSNYENNKRVPSEYNLKKIAKCLEIDMSDLVNWEHISNTSKIKTLADYTLEELLNEVLRRLN